MYLFIYLTKSNGLLSKVLTSPDFLCLFFKDPEFLKNFFWDNNCPPPPLIFSSVCVPDLILKLYFLTYVVFVFRGSFIFKKKSCVCSSCILFLISNDA